MAEMTLEMAASDLALPSSASKADREGTHASAHHGAYSSPQPPRATVRARRATRDATGLQSLSDTPQSRASRRPPSPRHSARQRSSDHNHLRCTEDRRHCNARWGERGQAAPESADESECGAVGSTSRLLRTTDGCYRHFSPMTESALVVCRRCTIHRTRTRFLPVSRPSRFQQVRYAYVWVILTGVSRLDVSHHLNGKSWLQLSMVMDLWPARRAGAPTALQHCLP